MKNYLKFDIYGIRRVLMLAAVLLAGVLSIAKCHAIGTGFHTPDMIEPMHPEVHERVQHDQDRYERDRIESKEISGGRLSEREKDFRDSHDAKSIRECSRPGK